MRTLLSSTIVLLFACTTSLQSGDAADVRLTVEPTPAAAGDSIVLTLDNGTANQIGYNLCTTSLERQTAGGWEVVPSDLVCTMELRTLEPGAEAEYRKALPAGLSAGQYRYRTNVELMPTGGYHAVTSSAFRVDA
jgi:hypothetical protein